MMTVTRVLDLAGVGYEPFTKWNVDGIYLTRANQLIGTYADLKRGAKSDKAYNNWHAHHIVETHDLRRLGIEHVSPVREQQLCVLLPAWSHIERINSALRIGNPIGVTASASQLRAGYQDAYEIMGDYCGGGEDAIRRELMAIVKAILQLSGLR